MTDECFNVVRAAALEDATEHEAWLVDGLWPREGVGILGGPPKSSKTWLGLDLALSIASGTPCLGRFAVQQPGSVLLYLAEDAPAMVRARLEGLCRHRGLDLAALPLDVITAPCLRLDLLRDRRRLQATIARHRPALLLLDPLVRMHRIDESDAGQVAEILDELRQLQRNHHTAICLVHHARKNGPGGSTGIALRGSVDFYAWADVLMIMQRRRDRLQLSIEHRTAPSPPALPLALAGEGDSVHLEPAERERGASASATREATLDTALLTALNDAPGPLGRGELRARLRVRNASLGEALTRLSEQRRIERNGSGWIPAARPNAIPDSPSSRRAGTGTLKPRS